MHVPQQLNNNLAMTHLALAVSALLGLYLVWTLYIKPKLVAKKPFDSIPMPGNNHWFFGQLLNATGDFITAQKTLALDPSDTRGRSAYYILNRPTLSLLNWADARTILQTEYYRDRPPIVGKMIGPAARDNNILFLSGARWKHHRGAVNKTLAPTSLEASKASMTEVTATMVESIKQRIAQQDGKFHTEIEPIMKMITLDIFGQAFFSYDFECCANLKPSPVAELFDIVANDLNARLANLHKVSTHFRSIPTEQNKALNKAVVELRGFVGDHLQARMSGDSTHKDLLTHLLSASAKQGKVDPDSLVSILISVLFAGYDTTSITLSYTAYLISQHPEVEAKCVEEIKRASSLENYEELPYCQAVITEALRLYSPAAGTSRTLEKDVTLHDGFVVPKGTNVNIPSWTLHRSEMNFARPDEFLPERWVQLDNPSDPNSAWVERDPSDTSGDVPAGNPKAIFSFSQGGRNCPGQKLAKQEAVIVFAGLLKEFCFTADDGYVIRPTMAGVVQHPHDQLPMTITLREQAV